MVFQFPAIGFPEGHPVNNMGEYELLRPYFFTKALRFSFGFNAGRPREVWQNELAVMPMPEAVKTLESYGFSALFINRKAFKDEAGRMLHDLALAGKTNVLDDLLMEQTCVLLNPSDHPEPPRAENYALVVFHHGWVDFQTIWHWSGGDATAYFVNESKEERTFRMSVFLSTALQRNTQIFIEGQRVWSGELIPYKVLEVGLSVRAKPGRNRVLFKTDAPAAPTKDSDLPIAIGVANLKFIAGTNAPSF
jgi:hypothetical protein